MDSCTYRYQHYKRNVWVSKSSSTYCCIHRLGVFWSNIETLLAFITFCIRRFIIVFISDPNIHPSICLLHERNSLTPHSCPSCTSTSINFINFYKLWRVLRTLGANKASVSIIILFISQQITFEYISATIHRLVFPYPTYYSFEFDQLFNGIFFKNICTQG